MKAFKNARKLFHAPSQNSRHWKLTVLTCMFFVLSVAVKAPNGVSAASSGQWKIAISGQGDLTAGATFSLYNTKKSMYVGAGYQEYGVNLKWYATAKVEWSVKRSGSATGPIKYGEMVAILNNQAAKLNSQKYDWWAYTSRDWGINLSWKDDPVYEWKISGGKDGDVVKHGNAINLFNTVTPLPDLVPWCHKKGAAVVYGSRPFGINLVWDPPGIWEGGNSHVVLDYLIQHIPFYDEVKLAYCS